MVLEHVNYLSKAAVRAKELKIEKEIKEYLNSLSDETLNKLVALMYLGRGDSMNGYEGAEGLEALMKYWIDREEGRKLTIDKLLEKGENLSLYFQDGLKKLRSKGIDPETI